MDIAAWKQLFRQSPEEARAEYERRKAQIPASQQAAIWAWQDDSPQWTTSDAEATLAGVPFASKDLYHQHATRTRAGGMLPSPIRRRDGNLIGRLRALGALPVAKTHLHEFAYGLTGENPHFGDVQHPQHSDRTIGGSSSGSAALVAAGIVPFALGSDTAGSLRVPAAYGGLYAWRDVPRHDWIRDAFPLAPQFDTAGWLTSTAHDTLTLLEALRGPLPAGERSARGAYLPASSLGVEMRPDWAELLAKVSAHFTTDPLGEDHDLATACRGVGHTYSVLQSSEAFAVHQHTLDSAKDLYGAAVWGRINRGRRWTARQLAEAAVHAMHIRAAFDRYFSDYDFLITPISAGPAPLLTETAPAIREALLQLNTHVSVAGKPALAVPVALANDLSLGLQIVFSSPHSSAIKWTLNRCKTCLDRAV